jgi:hypothetical protein
LRTDLAGFITKVVITMLAPVGIVLSKVDDRESWNQPKRHNRKPKKRRPEQALAVEEKKGEKIDLTA